MTILERAIQHIQSEINNTWGLRPDAQIEVSSKSNQNNLVLTFRRTDSILDLESETVSTDWSTDRFTVLDLTPNVKRYFL